MRRNADPIPILDKVIRDFADGVGSLRFQRESLILTEFKRSHSALADRLADKSEDQKQVRAHATRLYGVDLGAGSTCLDPASSNLPSFVLADESAEDERLARELPIPVDTKFIERHQGLLRRWFDIVLPPHAIRADEDHFERRYGLRYVEPHLLVRLLDSELKRELAFPCSEFSLPLSTLADLPVRRVVTFIRCRDSNIRLEQERLPQDKVLAEINRLPSPRDVSPGRASDRSP